MKIGFTTCRDLPKAVGQQGEPLVVMPFTNPVLASRSAAHLSKRADSDGLILCVHDEDKSGFISVANEVFRRSASNEFAYLAQDSFAGRSWLKRGREALAKNNGALVAFNDGKWSGALAAFGLVRKDWATENYDGDLFYPGYQSHYADVELTLIAMQQKKLRYDPEAIVVEVDWAKEGKAVDPADKSLYYKRGQKSFDRKVTDPGIKRLFQ